MKDIPLEVSLACYVIWISLFLDLLHMLLSTPLDMYFFATALIMFILSYWFISKLKAGKNWMRILIMIVNAITVLFFIISFNKVFNDFLYFLILIFSISQILFLKSKNSSKFFLNTKRIAK